MATKNKTRPNVFGGPRYPEKPDTSRTMQIVAMVVLAPIVIPLAIALELRDRIDNWRSGRRR